MVSKKLAIKHNAIPIAIENNNLIIAIAKENFYAVEDFKLATGKNIILKIRDEKEIKSDIERFYSKSSVESEDYSKRVLNELLENALDFNASDIHIEPFETNLRIRMRIDGYLKEIYNHSINMHMQLITVIKLLAGIDIAERRLPQDGRIDRNINGNIVDLRISTIPTIYGEKVVIRLLNRDKFIIDKKEIGFSDIAIDKVGKIIKNMSGILLITGPTGSGKTTTMYSILNDFKNMDKNIVTIEDPVEYKIEGINQIPLNTKIGLNFANGLRSILRQDPDIIMVGEIRDVETAQIAMRAASTGHFVISTMHTNNSVEAINRLLDMGIPRYLIASCLKGIISQRLVRRVCNYCSVDIDEEDNLKHTFKAKRNISIGCEDCNKTGFKGRVALNEIVEIDKKIRRAIVECKNIEEIYSIAKEDNMITFEDSFKYLLKENITTINECLLTNLFSEVR
ncbi:GspE/PulE family protein [Paraclostridium sordellii]|uniref:GspE/PulE family protein n=1 Tax=Paraclostridium sordellii TaxID=1505 RepID=UPI000386E518|nr:GspE/PulE family protein [Paeniclostridium sordellii]EPZ55167.1 type II/IV secretion system family protein [[Clostridium] sordellii VPI 9048] [Paeniclostridium sordellii VPI 9048]CEK36809.1 putative pilus assembly ATPase [[Clostridium] sordellii] [Paeniclostridium sordellii]